MESEHCQLVVRIDRIDHDFLFWNSAATGLALECSPSLSQLGPTKVSQGLALLYIVPTSIYLGFDTALMSSGVRPVTLASGGGGEDSLIVHAIGKHSLRDFTV